MEPNKLEQDFRDKLEQRTIQPSKMAWDRLDAMLSVNEEKEEQKVVAIKPNRSWMYMAASFVVLATIGAFFMTRETGNNDGGTENTVPTIVNTQAPVQMQDANNDTVFPATDNISTPRMQQQVVAAAQATKAPTAGKPSKTNTAPRQVIKEGNTITPQSVNEDLAIINQEKQRENAVSAYETEKLLSATTPANHKKKSSVKVDASSLLSTVEGELDESFRDKAIDGVIKNFNAVKTSVANRNYQ